MSEYDDHEIFSALSKYAPDDSREELIERSVASLALMDPVRRAEVIAEVAAARDNIETQAGMRQQAQVVNLVRRLSDAHETLRKVGR